MKWVSFRVHGKVQGVFFRRDTKKLADRLGLYGCVRNETDGTVTGKVGGDVVVVDQFLETLKVGVNDKARVDKCETSDLASDDDITSTKEFNILV